MNNRKIKLLIADDDEMLCRNLEAFFQDEDFDVTAETTGEGAIKSIENDIFDAGIIDMRLPGIDGNDLIFKAHKINPDMKFIIYTGSSNYVLPSNLANIGIDKECIFLKPVADTYSLINKINQLTGKK